MYDTMHVHIKKSTIISSVYMNSNIAIRFTYLLAYIPNKMHSEAFRVDVFCLMP